jgi:hypothetical protein
MRNSNKISIGKPVGKRHQLPFPIVLHGRTIKLIFIVTVAVYFVMAIPFEFGKN